MYYAMDPYWTIYLAAFPNRFLDIKILDFRGIFTNQASLANIHHAGFNTILALDCTDSIFSTGVHLTFNYQRLENEAGERLGLLRKL